MSWLLPAILEILGWKTIQVSILYKAKFLQKKFAVMFHQWKFVLSDVKEMSHKYMTFYHSNHHTLCEELSNITHTPKSDAHIHKVEL